MKALIALIAPPVMGALLTMAIAGKRRAVLAVAGAGIGFGISSCLYFLSVLFGISCVPLDMLALILSALAFLRRTTRSATPSSTDTGNMGLALLFWTVSFAESGLFWLISIRRPQGDWDAWAIHNLRARFLLRAGVKWHDAFSPLLDWSHPDYPLLVPASVARIWRYFGNESVFGPQFLAFFFTFATAAVLLVGVRAARGTQRGLLAGLFLLSTPLVAFGATQYADIPAGFFLLCTLVFSADEQPLLAGLAASLAAWTKNEGLLYLAAWAFARVISLLIEGRRNCLREAGSVLAGALPVMALVVWFKAALAPVNDLHSGLNGHFLTWLTDFDRHKLVAEGFLKHGLFFGSFLIPPAILLLVCMFLDRVRLPPSANVWTPVLSIVFILTGDYFVYVLSFRSIPWLIDTSLNRVLMQLCPATVFAVFALPLNKHTLSWHTCPRPGDHLP